MVVSLFTGTEHLSNQMFRNDVYETTILLSIADLQETLDIMAKSQLKTKTLGYK